MDGTVNDGVQAIYQDRNRELCSLKLKGECVNPDKIYTLGIQGYHFLNCFPNLSVTQDELQNLSEKKLIATSMRNVVEEYLRSHQNIYAQEEGRLVFI